jgi:hypothetical protein
MGSFLLFQTNKVHDCERIKNMCNAIAWSGVRDDGSLFGRKSSREKATDKTIEAKCNKSKGTDFAKYTLKATWTLVYLFFIKDW